MGVKPIGFDIEYPEDVVYVGSSGTERYEWNVTPRIGWQHVPTPAGSLRQPQTNH